MSERENTGIRDFLRMIAERTEDVRTGRIVVFGTRRTGFNQRDFDQSERISEERAADQRINGDQNNGNNQ